MSSSQVWLITVASKGLGYELAKAPLENDQAVAATARNPPTLDSLAQYARNPANFFALKLDITSNSEIQGAFDGAVKHFGKINVVFSGAGASTIGEVEALSYEDIQSRVDVGLTDPINVTRCSISVLRISVGECKVSHGGGTLLQVTSVGCLIPSPGLSIYHGYKSRSGPVPEHCCSRTESQWGINMFPIRPARFETEWAKGST